MDLMRQAAMGVMLAAAAAVAPQAHAAPRKHTVVLGAVRRVPYSSEGDPAGAAPDETQLRIRALVVDGAVKEWVTGDVHDVTDRSYVVRRALRLNDSLPGDRKMQWVWQRGPWLLVDRVTGHVTALKLPDYDPAVSHVSWFRDYAAYCGVTASGKSLYAVVAQLAVRKPMLAKKLAPLSPDERTQMACGAPAWQREPMRVTFSPAGRDTVSFNLVPGSAVLVEDSGDDADTTQAARPE